eukprot:TRINITY_DN60555_c0_g1_i1.p1 TRINITY_DN60555_c0_g1~~TRINITY_DN60555_c0_g1_i1.p1  ORF type:complete len:357 (-),score=54.35 TRINITY_DN60555_c0_g1_i1:12-1043(-)
MSRVVLSGFAILVTSLRCITVADALPVIFGEPGALSAVPRNVAKYILDIERKQVYLHYFGEGQIFRLVLSPTLREHLQVVSNASDSEHMPIAHGLDQLSGGMCNWQDLLSWTSSDYGANAKDVFYGREIRQAPGTLYGNAIHLSLGPKEDPEGWTSAEMAENFEFWQAIHEDGQSVAAADGLRSFRKNIASQIGKTFMQRWGTQITTKAHRFTLQMYNAETQNEANNPGGLFFETFPNGMPPTAEVVFFEAEDGCKGTPMPARETSMLFEVPEEHAHALSTRSRTVQPFMLAVMLSVFVASTAILVASRCSRQILHGSTSSAISDQCNCQYEDVEQFLADERM